MKAVARGAKAAQKNAALPSFESASALLRLLTPANRELLAVIRDKKPQSITELAQLTGRAQPNVIRTLGKLEAMGFVQMKAIKQRRVPTTVARSFRIKIDPFSTRDRFEWA
ncbi:MAG: helix-turn-helix domain-containing protein [Acetobacteraceae bacterium]